METWIKAQLCANCARKNLPITGASATISMLNMLQLAETTRDNAPSLSRQCRQSTLDKMTGFRAKMSQSTTDKITNSLVKLIAVDCRPLSVVEDQGLEAMLQIASSVDQRC